METRVCEDAGFFRKVSRQRELPKERSVQAGFFRKVSRSENFRKKEAFKRVSVVKLLLERNDQKL